MTKSTKTTVGVAGAGLSAGIPTVWLGVLPVWVLAVCVVVMLVVTAVVLLGREVVSQLIRVRASLADPVGTLRVEAGVACDAQPVVSALPAGGAVPARSDRRVSGRPEGRRKKGRGG